MRFPNSSGLLLSIVDGFIKDEEMMVQCVDNYHYPFRDFIVKALKRDLTSVDLKDCVQAPRLYIIAGHNEKIRRVGQVWRTRINQVFEQLIRNKHIQRRIKGMIKKTDHYCLESMFWLYLAELITTDNVYYPRMTEFSTEDKELVILVFYWTPSPNVDPIDQVGHTISFWLDREQLALRGYQCLSRSSILRNMVGRKVLATFPDRLGNWGMLLEGGIFLPLADDFEVGLSKLNSMHIGQWTIGEVEEILLNPIYAFGYDYQHIDLICEWFYVFLYGLATIDEEELATINLEFLYRRFCEFLGKHICSYIIIEQKIIEVDQFIVVLKKTLANMREFLKGGEETGVSKNILLMMRNRHAFLPEVHRFIRRNSGLVLNNTPAITLDYGYWREALSQLEEISRSYEKGKKLEELTKYFMSAIPGIRVTDIRSKRGRAEVDIYCCNVSYDSWLWRLGALILIECKNRKNKVEVSDIRNLVPTMEAKGITGAMVFSRAGFTSFAIEEIKHQLSGGKMIVPISLKELEGIGVDKGTYDFVRGKIEHFERIMENETEQMYF
ncbi:restriction endonuclease [Paenibacillus sp. TH7-28]